jgi:small conductance mechanosensitive channel
LILFAVLLLAPPLFAQENDTTAAPVDTLVEEQITDLDRARDSLQQLSDLEKDLRELMRSSRKLTGEDYELKRVEALEIVARFDDLVKDLTKTIPNLDSTSAPVDSIRQATADHLLYHAELYLKAVDSLSKRLARLRRERAESAPEDLGQLELLINEQRKRLDFTLAQIHETVQRLESLQVDATDLRTEFDQVVLDRAEAMAARLQLARLEKDRANEQLKGAQKAGASEAELAELRLLAQAHEQRVKGIVSSLDATADILDHRGIDTAKYRRHVIQTTGEVTEDILKPDVLIGLARDFLGQALGWIRNRGPGFLVKLAILILLVIVFRLGAWIGWFLVRLVTRPQKLLADLIGRLLKPVASLVGLVVGLWVLGVHPTTLLAGLGVLSVIVGLALQDSLGNLAAGFFILVYRPYDVDDIVQAGGVLGTVKQMGLASTTILTFDNRRLNVPNRKIWSEVIENRSAERARRVETTVSVSYDDDIDAAIERIHAILEAEDLVLGMPKPTVFVAKHAESWVEVAVWPWTRVENWWTLTMELPRILRAGLKEAGIEVPFPRQEIQVLNQATSAPPPRAKGKKVPEERQ